ncbi:hypothetical protein [Paenibacillus tundrae]|uniref:hypothetical protein n=1 Tax=Paenibacillus tundrae TaxID=528187 RepID=UPI0030D32F88
MKFLFQARMLSADKPRQLRQLRQDKRKWHNRARKWWTMPLNMTQWGEEMVEMPVSESEI